MPKKIPPQKPVHHPRAGLHSHSSVRFLRLALNWRQEDLARAAGCSQLHISELELGHIDGTPELRARIAAVLDSTVDELFPGFGLPAGKVEASRARRG